jgi:hypothetical protein
MTEQTHPSDEPVEPAVEPAPEDEAGPAVEEPTEEEIDAEEESAEEPVAAQLDLDALVQEAERRVAKIEARGKDASKTFAGYVVAYFEEKPEAEQLAMRGEAQRRLDGPLAGSSETYRKHSLAGKVANGEFDR